MSKINKITDLVEDALKEDDYKFRVNFIVAGLIAEESNDTAEKREQNKILLGEIVKFSGNYAGDAEKESFLRRTEETIENYLQNTTE